jgi:hypothetical protein
MPRTLVGTIEHFDNQDECEARFEELYELGYNCVVTCDAYDMHSIEIRNHEPRIRLPYIRESTFHG